MRIFDLHCDTISTCLNQHQTLARNDLHIDLERGTRLQGWVQAFALWIDDRFQGEDAYHNFCEQYALFQRFAEDKRIQPYTGQEPEQGTCYALLSVENGSALAGRIERVEELAQKGVRLLTLTWNGRNEIASGVGEEDGGGLSPFGRQAVAELERCGIVIDVSHLNDRGFEELCGMADRPFIASHSNARRVCGHQRNLEDWQIQEISSRGGIIGLNLYRLFLSDRPRETSGHGWVDAVLRHTEHILTIGGADCLALGTDFDGAEMPDIFNGIQTLENLIENMLQYYSESVLNKIFYTNAADFFKRYEC